MISSSVITILASYFLTDREALLMFQPFFQFCYFRLHPSNFERSYSCLSEIGFRCCCLSAYIFLSSSTRLVQYPCHSQSLQGQRRNPRPCHENECDLRTPYFQSPFRPAFFATSCNIRVNHLPCYCSVTSIGPRRE